jgi:adenosylhomocysteine nucleosidase
MPVRPPYRRTPDRPHIVVMTALASEFTAVMGHLSRPVVITHPAGTRFTLGTLPGIDRPVAVTVTGEGNQTAAVIAERAIASFRPEVLLLVGTAGALRPDVRLGDVVVATRIYAYHGGRHDRDGFTSRPRCWEAPHGLCQLARAVAAAGSWSTPEGAGPMAPIHFGGVAAGEVILNSRQSPLAHRLRRRYGDAVAIEMESAGVAQAAHLNPGVAALTIRGISDLADGTKDWADRGGWPARAAINAAAFATALIGQWSRELPQAGRS